MSRHTGREALGVHGGKERKHSGDGLRNPTSLIGNCFSESKNWRCFLGCTEIPSSLLYPRVLVLVLIMWGGICGRIKPGSGFGGSARDSVGFEGVLE